MPDINELKTEYATRASQYWSWLNSAQDLLFVAESMEYRIERLWKAVDHKVRGGAKHSRIDLLDVVRYQGVYLMLMAYCLENLLKAHIVREHSESVKKEILRTAELPRYIKTHDLILLVGKCGLSPTDVQLGLLRRLTKHAKWIGRYPFGPSVIRFYDLRPPAPPSSETGWSLEQAKDVKHLAVTFAALLKLDVRLKPIGRRTKTRW